MRGKKPKCNNYTYKIYPTGIEQYDKKGNRICVYLIDGMLVIDDSENGKIDYFGSHYFCALKKFFEHLLKDEMEEGG